MSSVSRAHNGSALTAKPAAPELPPPEGTRPQGPKLPPSDRLAEAARIRGLNVAVGLQRVCGQSKVLEKCLRLAPFSLAPGVARMRSLLRDEKPDLREFGIIAHGLKGALANIGAMSLTEQARDLEKAACREDPAACAEALEDFAGELASFLARLQELFAEPEERRRPAGDPALLARKGELLLRYLAAYDYDNSVACLRELLACSFGGKLNRSLLQVNACLERFAYDQAAAVLAALLEEISEGENAA